ncbi:caspase family protein [Kitasatospora sp. NPDC058218]|uniref:caspase, EACC1-associated type n=1 Tax=Kitasatospora sp. NPDC058218 TaxID=3346385 RepID=UPI0036D797E6
MLLGAAEYAAAELPAIPAVTENLTALRDVLTTGPRALLAPGHCQILGDRPERPISVPAVGAALAAADGEAADLMLVYYAGHGLLDRDGRLHLALPPTDPDQVEYTAIPLDLIRRDLARARARTRILILDCCFSGRAVAAMSAPTSLLSGQLELSGTYTLTSTTSTAPSHAPVGARFTAFTGALLEALAGPEPLTLDEIHAYADRKLAALALPRPQRRAVNTAGDLVLVRGRAVPEVASASVPAPRAGGTPRRVRFGDEMTPRRRRTLMGKGVLLIIVTLAIVMIFVHAGQAPGALGAILPGAMALWSFVQARQETTFLNLEDTGISLSDGDRLLGSIPWENIAYLGALKWHSPAGPAPGGGAVYRDLLIVRLHLHTEVPPSAQHFVTFTPTTIKAYGYISVCQLSEVDADPVRLRQAVTELAGPLYRSDQELIEWDPRLAH